MTRRTISIFILLLVIMSFITVVPKKTEAGPYTYVNIILNQSSVEVDVSPGSTCVAQITGICQIGTRNPMVPVIVNLEATGTEGVTATVAPSSIVAMGSDEVQISVSIKAQPLMSRKSQPIVTVSGTYTQGAMVGEVGKAQCQVIIKPYYMINIYSENPYIEISPGDGAVFSLKLFNMGNDQDTYRFKIDNEGDLVGVGWTLPSIPKLTIDEKMPKTLSWSVQSPQKWTIWENKVWMIKLKVISENSRGKVKEDYSLFVRTKGIHIPGFEPALVALAILAVVGIERKRRKYSLYR